MQLQWLWGDFPSLCCAIHVQLVGHELVKPFDLRLRWLGHGPTVHVPWIGRACAVAWPWFRHGFALCGVPASVVLHSCRVHGAQGIPRMNIRMFTLST